MKGMKLSMKLVLSFAILLSIVAVAMMVTGRPFMTSMVALMSFFTNGYRSASAARRSASEDETIILRNRKSGCSEPLP